MVKYKSDAFNNSQSQHAAGCRSAGELEKVIARYAYLFNCLSIINEPATAIGADIYGMPSVLMALVFKTISLGICGSIGGLITVCCVVRVFTNESHPPPVTREITKSVSTPVGLLSSGRRKCIDLRCFA